MSTRPTTIEETAVAMGELAVGTNPSMLHALRVAGISPRLQLKNNIGYALRLCQWRDAPLPPREELITDLKMALSPRADGSLGPAWGLMGMHIDTLYAIDAFWFGNPGCQEYVTNIGETLDEQRRWRCWMNDNIWGMGFKTLSWAAFIYSPQTCQLLTLDSWHARRLAVDPSSVARDLLSSHTLYMQLEDRVIAEVSEKYPCYLPTVGAACEWYNARNSGPESHAGLNCRVQEPEWEVA